MLSLRNCDIKEFAKRTANKDIICFGAMIMPVNFCKAYPEYSFENRITFLADNDKEKWGTKVELANGISREVISPSKLREEVEEGTVILITCSYFAAIIDQLDQYDELDKIDCYIYPFMQYDRKFEKIDSVRHSDRPLIPRKIHYFWFGGNQKPDFAIKCIESWKRYCPDFEFIEWNENNYDISKNRFMSEAYEAKKWGFVPDYARLETVYKYGGVYFDTDVELIKPIDDLLYNEAFFGFGNYGRINTGGGFGAIEGNKLIKNLLSAYDEFTFFKKDGTIDYTTNTVHEEPIFISWGMTPNDTTQYLNGALFLQSDFMAPLVPEFVHPRVTDNTVSIHYGTRTWESKENLDGIEQSRKQIESIRHRIDIEEET